MSIKYYYRGNGFSRHPQNILSKHCRVHILLKRLGNFSKKDHILGHKANYNKII